MSDCVDPELQRLATAVGVAAAEEPRRRDRKPPTPTRAPDHQLRTTIFVSFVR